MEFEFTQVTYFTFKDRWAYFEGGCHTDFTFQICLLCSCVCKHRKGCSSPSGTSRITQETAECAKWKSILKAKMCRCGTLLFSFYFLVILWRDFHSLQIIYMHCKAFKQYKIFASPFLFPKCHTSHQKEPLLIIGHF